MNSASVIGLGVVGGALYKCLQMRGCSKIVGYDKFKDGFDNTFEDILETEIAFLCLPTLYDEDLCEYNKSAIHDVCSRLNSANYSGLVVVKSTVEPGATQMLVETYPNLDLVHSPEFITARTALEDSLKPTQVVLGRSTRCSDENFQKAINFFIEMSPNETPISSCTSLESEMMKICVNSFYAVKVQFFNEIYLLSQNNGANYETVKNIMLKNRWINTMHTNVPGPDGKLSYGGMCFPKDTKALSSYMTRQQTPNAVLQATITERDSMRDD